MLDRRMLMLLLVLLLAAGASSCGTSNVGAGGPVFSGPQSARSVGVVAGGFEVIRQNQRGYDDAQLNTTLSLDLQDQGAEKALVISVRDSSFTTTVALDVNYDQARFHPVRAEFTKLMGGQDKVLTVAILDSRAGTAGVGATAIRDCKPAPLNGQFATVYFASGPDRAVANVAGDAHENPLGVADVLGNVGLPNLVIDTTTANQVVATWTSAWMIGNGDGNKEVNVSDLQPIGANFKGVPSTDFAAVKGDYDRNDETNVSDLQKIGVFFKRFTDSYVVEAGDDDGSGMVNVATLDGSPPDQQPAVGPPAAGDLTTVFPFWRVTINTSSAFTFAQLAALDVDADGQVLLSITPKGLPGKADGVTVSNTVQVTVPPPPTDQLVIDGFSVSVNDGAGTPAEIGVLDPANTSITALADGKIGFTLKGITGSFNGTPFTGRPATDPTEDNKLHQADYDAAFTAAQGFLIWDFSTGGDTLARRTGPWVTFASGSSPYLGVLPTGGTIFPDWDPESTLATTPEGSLVCTLPIDGGPLPGGGTATYPADANLAIKVIGSPVVSTFKVDVDTDPAQSTLGDYKDGVSAGPLDTLILNRRNVVRSDFTWGTGGEPADHTTVSLELVRLDLSGNVVNSTPFVQKVTTDQTTLNPGEWAIEQKPPPAVGFYFYAVINSSGLVQGGTYALRMNANGVWTTINVPAGLLTTAPPPQPQPLITVPGTLNDANDTLQILYNDATIHRNGAMMQSFTAPPAHDPLYVAQYQAAYDDLLKSNGTEFAPAFDTSQTPSKAYPVIVVKDATLGAITDENDAGQVAGLNVIERGTGRLILDVAAITFGGVPGSPKTYNFLVFDPGGVQLGQGSFVYDTTFNFNPSPGNLQWGINVFNRENRDLSARNYDTLVDPSVHTLDGTGIATAPAPTAAPPVFFFEFSGGAPFSEFAPNPPGPEEEAVYSGSGLSGDTTGTLPYIVAQDAAIPGGPMMTLGIGLRLAGVSPNNTYIMIHTATYRDFSNAGAPGWTGMLTPGTSYNLYVIDPINNITRQPDPTCQFPGQLLVVGQNPNP